jgi:diguanylate cyclase (GGDEF)-like protein
LNFSKNEAGKAALEMRDFVLEQPLKELVILLAPQVQKKNINLVYATDVDIPQCFVGDSDRLRQVLVYLVGNAIKFTERGGVFIEVKLVELHDDGATLCFEVSDTGVGITREQQNRIFEAFSQADGSTTRKYGGTGLGLAISRQLVHLMGGEMGVTSDYGQGSCFWFTLQLQQSENKSLPPASARVQQSELRVLIVDNCDMVCRSLSSFFDAQGISWEFAATYAQSVEKVAGACSGGGFDIVLVDEDLDQGRGVELAQWLERSDVRNMCCLVMVHRAVETGELSLARDCRLISKPLQHAELLNLIDQLNLGGAAVQTKLAEHGDVVLGSFNKGLVDTPPLDSARVNIEGRNILVVEDDRANQQVAQAMLETMGCGVEIVSNGRECLEEIARSSYDLVLMDCHMPELDGYKTTAIIREHEQSGQRIPIVAMTANVISGESDKCLAAGMDDYLSKPLTRDSLKDKVVRWLGVSSTEQVGRGADTSQEELSSPEVVNSFAGERSRTQVLDDLVLKKLQDQLGPAFEKIINALIEDLPMYLAALDEALQGGEPETLANVAHTIKGSAGNIGAHQLVAASEELETHARGGRLDGAQERVQKIQEAGRAVVSCLQTDVPYQAAQSSVPRILASLDPTKHHEEAQASILIVDDDRGSRLAMAEVLRNEGYRVEEATDGEQALAQCEVEAPDLILMDAVMPKMDGFTACSLLQELSQTKGVPVLIITALHDEASINKAFSSGATDYIPKPVNFWVLSKRIEHLVQAHRTERHVHRLAYNDVLTGLPNRARFNERLNESIDRPRRSSDRMAVLFLDLDRFKLINDTLGHETGDLLLKYFAERVQGCLRKQDVVARFGGDEFTILLDRVKSPEAVCQVAEKIHEQLSRPFVFMGREMYVSTSIGIALFPEHGKDMGTLLKSADMAMYRAKKQSDRYRFYQSNMEVEVSRRLELENDLRGAMERKEFIMLYQPQEELSTGEVTGMEALVRWQHPSKGLVGPLDFIELAEETGQIIALGEWILQRVCRQSQDWYLDGYERIRVSVNLSGKQIIHPGLVHSVATILEETQLPAQFLELEITESTLMEDPEQVIATLNELKAMGLSLAIDDFGTGYSSLSYLRRFPVDVIKIDRSFVSDIISNQVDADIVKTIIDLAHVMGVQVVAEGVETELQKALLKKQGCDLLQGYYLGRPQSTASIEGRFLTRARTELKQLEPHLD